MPEVAVDPRWVEGLQAVLLLGMALLAWREFRAIRAKMKADRARRDAERKLKDHLSPGD